MAVLLLCICYGVCKLHSQPLARGTSNSNPHRTPVPSPHLVQRTPSIKGKSPSFHCFPLAASPGHVRMDLNAVMAPTSSVAPQCDVTVIDLAQIPSTSYVSSSRSHTSPSGVTSHRDRDWHRPTALPPLQLQPVMTRSPTVAHQKTPRSASTEFRPPAARATRSASTEFFRPNRSAYIEKRKTPPAIAARSSSGSAVEGSGISAMTVTKTSEVSSILTSRSTEV